MNIQVDSNTTEDTEFNAILREKGILPALPKPKEETPPPSPETQRHERLGKMSYKELQEELEAREDEGGDDLDEDLKFLKLYRQKRMDEMREAAMKAKFGYYGEVTKSDWTDSVNKAGDGVYVVVHLAQTGNEKCTLVDQHMQKLAVRYPAVKFLRGETSMCVPNFPEENLPTVIVYYEGDVKMQFVGSKALGGHPCSMKDLEQRLAKAGAIRLADTGDDGDNEDGSGAVNSINITRIRTGGVGHRRGQAASDSDSD